MKPLYTAYTILTSGIFLSCFPSFWLYTRLSGRHRKGLKERLGFVPRLRVQNLPESPRIWLHAVSLGEVNVAAPIVKSLSELIPDCSFILSATTDHGIRLARETFGEDMPKKRNRNRNFLLVFFVVFAISFALPFPFQGKADAGLVMFDDVATPGAPIFLKVETRRMVFPDGGQRVWVRIGRGEERLLLTGGDGCGYLKTQFLHPGMETWTARSKTEKNEARVLVLGTDTPVLVIEVAAVFSPALLRKNEFDACRRVLTTLSEQFPILYLGGRFGAPVIRDWLADHGYPVGPVLAGRSLTVLQKLRNRGICFGALLGSGKLSTAADFIANRYCFEKTSEAVHVRGWEELHEQLTAKDFSVICNPAVEETSDDAK